MHGGNLDSDYRSPNLPNVIDRLSEAIADIGKVTEGAECPHPELGDFPGGILGRELAALIVFAAWNVGGEWAGRFSAVMVAALRVAEADERQGGTEQDAECVRAREALAGELRGCPMVSQESALSIAWAVLELSALGSSELSEVDAI